MSDPLISVCTRGITRLVILVGPFAFKFPTNRTWKLFLTGILCNNDEVLFSKLNSPYLCPVLFSIPGGFCVVMKRAKPFKGYIPSGWYNRHPFKNMIERKDDSFGILDGRIVAVDYGSYCR